MIDPAEAVDAAIDSDRPDLPPELAALVDMAGELRSALQRTWLTPWERDALYARVLETATHASRWAGARRILLDRRITAIAGGAAVTLAAGAAIGVAIARQHRHTHAPAPI